MNFDVIFERVWKLTSSKIEGDALVHFVHNALIFTTLRFVRSVYKIFCRSKISSDVISWEVVLTRRVFWNRLEVYIIRNYSERYIIWWNCLTIFFWHDSCWNYFWWICRMQFLILFWNTTEKISREKFGGDALVHFVHNALIFTHYVPLRSFSL